jgi:PAS domain S-box-containing protein
VGISGERQLQSANTNRRHGSVGKVESAMEPRVLKSWKDISAYLKVGVSTAQRWERDHGLPVRRPSGKSGTAVVAFSNEIDWWLKTGPARKPSDRTSESDSPSAANSKSLGLLEATIITNALWSRPSRPPDLEAEIEVFREIARDMVTRDPSTVLNSLITHAVRLCKADSAGISLLEKDQDNNNNDDQIFRWVAAKGAMEQYIGGTTPRNFSPCGICLERNCAQLFSHPERSYTYLQRILPMTELLLIPLYADNDAMGTLWVMSHDGQRKFDREDARILSSLTDFTGLALRTLQTQQQHKEPDEQNRHLLEALPGLVGTAEADGNASFFNERWLNYTGMSLEQARGWGWRGAIHPEDLPRYENAWRTALRTGEGYDVEYRLRRGDGEYRRQLGHVAPLRNSSGEVVLWLATSTDINDRKPTRTVLTKSNDHERSSQMIVA